MGKLYAMAARAMINVPGKVLTAVAGHPANKVR